MRRPIRGDGRFAPSCQGGSESSIGTHELVTRLFNGHVKPETRLLDRGSTHVPQFYERWELNQTAKHVCRRNLGALVN